MRVASVVAANGTGHFRRTVGVLHRLVTARPSLTVTVFCTAAQLHALSRWWRLRQLSEYGTQFVTDVECGFRWPLSREPADLLAWRDQLAALTDFRQADLLLSDNLASVLAVRPDAVLMGSFLWSDVLAKDPRAATFVADEMACLRATHPPMLCVEAIATPTVMRETAAVPLPWMCEDPATQPRSLTGPPRIGVCGGTTEAAADQLSRIATVLSSRYDVVIDRPSPPDVGGSSRPLPGGLMRDIPLTDVDLVVCRPGAGTVMDCVATNTPFLTFHEPDSPEMIHIAGRLAELGIAPPLPSRLDEQQILSAVDHLADPATYREASERLHAQRKDGLDHAVAWMTTRLADAGDVRSRA